MAKVDPSEIYPTPSSGRFKATDDESLSYHPREEIIHQEYHDPETRKKTWHARMQKFDDKVPKILGTSLIVFLASATFGAFMSVAGGTARAEFSTDVLETSSPVVNFLTNVTPGAIFSAIATGAAAVFVLTLIFSIIRAAVKISHDGSTHTDGKVDHTPPHTASIGT